MAPIRKRALTPVAAALALLAVVTGCGSSAPARPAALDPSNPDAEESPRVVVGPQGAATPVGVDSDANVQTSPDSRATPRQAEPHPHGDGAPPEKGAQ